MSQQLSWGILSTGRIASVFAKGLACSCTGRLVAVGSRTQASADKFGDEYQVPRRYGNYAELLTDTEVQAVYIATPHPMHTEWSIKAAEAGKHVLCEKPLTMNHAEAMAVIEAARRHDVFLMEAFMYRCHPQIARLVELICNKAIGEVRVIQATFSFAAPFNPRGRLYNKALGGGGILDVGCYCTSMARLIAGVATGGDFAEPIDIQAVGRLSSTGVDAYTVAGLTFPGGIVAELATGIDVLQENVVRIFGSEGHIVVPVPWSPCKEPGTSRILLYRNTKPEPEEIQINTDRGLFTIEADTVAAHIDRSQAPPPCMTWDDTLGNMKTLDRWRAAIGVVYDADKL